MQTVSDSSWLRSKSILILIRVELRCNSSFREIEILKRRIEERTKEAYCTDSMWTLASAARALEELRC